MAKIRGGGLEVKGKGEGESNKKINLFLKTEKERKKNCESFWCRGIKGHMRYGVVCVFVGGGGTPGGQLKGQHHIQHRPSQVSSAPGNTV